MSTVRIGTNFNIDIEFTAPPFYQRLGAWVIDVIIQIFYLIAITKLLMELGWDRMEDTTQMAVGLLILLPPILYHLVLEATMNGQSIGKKIVGIKVVSDKGGRPALSQLIIRWMIRTSDYSILIIILMLNNPFFFQSNVSVAVFITMGFLVADLVLINTRKQQRLGDILGHTVLINTRQKEKITDTVFLEVGESYVAKFPQIMQLSDRDMNALKGIIDTSRKHKDYNMALMAAEKIKAHLKIDTYMEPHEFLEVLLKDYNHLSAGI